MSIDLGASYLITAPSGVDGFGEQAVLNSATPLTDTLFVGYLADLIFAREVRESRANKADADGSVQGTNRSGGLPFTMRIQMIRASTFAVSNARADKLAAALDAEAADGTMVWTEAGRVQTRLLFRQQDSLRGPDNDGIVLASCVSASPLILATSAIVPSGSTYTNAGKAATWPTITFTAPASGTVTLSRTSPSPTQTLTLTVGGTNGLTASTSTTVDFYNGTVLQGSTYKQGAVQYPASVWWQFAPGANTFSSTGATGVTVTAYSAWKP